MNFEDIKAFIDLVKNPAKYDNVLDQFIEREARWTALVEAHTEISKVNKYVADKQKEADAVVAKAKETADAAELEAAKLKALAKEMLEKAEADRAEAQKTEAESKATRKVVKALEKELTDEKAKLADESAQLVKQREIVQTLQVELQAKLDKFKELVK